MPNREESALFVLVVATPGGDLAVPAGSTRVTAQAARHLSERRPHIGGYLESTRTRQPLGWWCLAAPAPTGEPLPDSDAPSPGKAASMGRHHNVASIRKILFAGRQARAHVATAPLLTIELVNRCTEVSHRVTDEAFAAGRCDGGCYRAMCGAQVLLASLTPPARGHCPACDRNSTRVVPVEIDSPDVVIPKRLLDHAKLRGFEFQRIAPGGDGPLRGNRVSGDWVDLIHIEGFNRDCFAWRQRISPLIVPESALVQRRIDGSALDVLNEVLTWEP